MRRTLIGVCGVATLVAACGQRQPTQEWTPGDHDRADPGRSPNQVRQSKVVDEEAELANLAWDKDCTKCHGEEGQGDGPMAQMNHAPDLTRDEFLSANSDEQITAIIREGRKQMPKFKDLPDRAVAGLVRRIRQKGHL